MANSAPTFENVRDAIGAALGWPCSADAFRIVDDIEARVTEDSVDPNADHHETAAEIAEVITDAMSTIHLVLAWAVLGADNAAEERDAVPDVTDTTYSRIRRDVEYTIEAAAHAGLVAFANETEEV